MLVDRTAGPVGRVGRALSRVRGRAPGAAYEARVSGSDDLTRSSGPLPDLATTAFVREERGGRVFLDSTRAGGATVVAAYSPRARPGVPVSYPVAWDDLDCIRPADFTVRTVPALIGDGDPWADAMPPPQRLPTDLIEEGHRIPIARVAAMHAGKRRKRAAGNGGVPAEG